MNPYKVRNKHAPPFEPLWLRLQKEPGWLDVMWSWASALAFPWSSGSHWNLLRRAATELDDKSVVGKAISECEWNEFDDTADWLHKLQAEIWGGKPDDAATVELVSEAKERAHGLEVLRELASNFPRTELQHLAHLSLLDAQRNMGELPPLNWRARLRSWDGHYWGDHVGDRISPDRWASLDDLQAFCYRPSECFRSDPLQTITPQEINQIWSTCYYSPGAMPELLLMPLQEIEAEDLLDALTRGYRSTRERCDSNFLLMLRAVESAERVNRIDDRLLSIMPQIGVTEGERINIEGSSDTAFNMNLGDDRLESPLNSNSQSTQYDRPQVYLTYVARRLAPNAFVGNPLQSPTDQHCSLWIEASCSSGAWPAIQQSAATGLQTALWLLESLRIDSEQDAFRLDECHDHVQNMMQNKPYPTGFDQGMVNAENETLYACIRAPQERVFTERMEGPPGFPDFEPGSTYITHPKSPTITNDGYFIRSILDVWWEPWDKKDTLQRRLRNSVLLVHEAMSQSNVAIQLALLTSAIEALIGDKNQEGTRLLIDRLEVLLEPMRQHRRDCKQLLKTLYDRRSQILHGSDPFAHPNDAFLMRLVLASAMHAVLSHNRMAGKMGIDYSKADFMTVLEEHSDSGQELIGITPQIVRLMWGIPVPPPKERIEYEFDENAGGPDAAH